MQLHKLASGNLNMVMDRDDESLVSGLLDQHGDDDLGFLSSLLDTIGWSGNGVLHLVNPQDVGALTEAPIISDGISIHDDGTIEVHGQIWWFPDYAVRHVGQDLLQHEHAIFTAV